MSKRDVEALVARWFPKPAEPDVIRKLPAPRAQPKANPSPSPPAAPSPAARLAQPPIAAPALATTAVAPVVQPLSADHFKVQFTADRALNDKLREARDLLRHQIPDGSLAAIIDRALDLLIREVKKQRFGTGRAGRAARPAKPGSRHIPDAIKRAVFERDEGQCAFVDDRGQRCQERGGLELDHIRGFARDPTHSLEGIRLLCRAHNQHLAERLYGADFMERRRRGVTRAEPADAPPPT